MTVRKISVRRMILIIAYYSIVANMVHPISPTIYTNLHFHDYMFGVAFACMSLTNFAFSPFWGKMCDRYGSTKIMAIGSFGYAFGQVLFGISKTELQLSLARILAGSFVSTISVGQLIYVMRYSPREESSKNLMYLATANAVMAPVGFLVGGFLGDVTLFGTVMTQVAGLALLGVFMLVLVKDEPISAPAMDRKELLRSVNPLKSFGEIRPWLSPFLIVFFVIAFLTNFASTCYEQSFNYLIKAEYGFPSSYNGMLKALVGIVALVSNLTLCKALLKHTDSRKSTVAILAVQTLMSAGIAAITPLVPFIIINVVFFGMNAIYLPLLQATMTKAATKANSGIFAGMFNAVRSMGSIAGSLIAGFLYTVHCRAPFFLTTVLFAAAVGCSVLNYRQHMQTAPQSEN